MGGGALRLIGKEERATVGCLQLGEGVQAGFKARELGELRETLRGQCPMETIYFNKYFSIVPFLPLGAPFICELLN